jgi:hypothetical protein
MRLLRTSRLLQAQPESDPWWWIYRVLKLGCCCCYDVQGGSSAALAHRLAGPGSLNIEKKANIIDVVEHEKPPLLAVTQPVVYQLKDVRLRILPPSDFDAVGHVTVPVALPEPSSVTSMHPEHPRLRRPLVGTIGMLDSELRLASQLLVYSAS